MSYDAETAEALVRDARYLRRRNQARVIMRRVRANDAAYVARERAMETQKRTFARTLVILHGRPFEAHNLEVVD